MLKAEEVKNRCHIISHCTTFLSRGKGPDVKRKLFALVAFPAHRRCSARVADQFGNWNVTVRRIYGRASGVSLIKLPRRWLRADLISFRAQRLPHLGFSHCGAQ